jgi:hypothetical protein
MPIKDTVEHILSCAESGVKNVCWVSIDPRTKKEVLYGVMTSLMLEMTYRSHKTHPQGNFSKSSGRAVTGFFG